MMELSENTLSILKNYAGINSNMVIEKGNTVRTISEATNILSSAQIVEDFPTTFGVYDLNSFLGVLSLVDTPNLDFSDDYLTVSDSSGRSKIKYFYSDPEMLTKPRKNVVMPTSDVNFTLDADTLGRVKRAASALGHTELSITGSDGVLTLSVVDSKNATSNVYSIDVVGDFDTTATFNFIVTIANLKLIPGNYEVSISSKNISLFSCAELGISYWIAFEKSSTYGA
jgi:hypothetical protein|tara:strand:- start:25413 stop:26093 length:681 start_codon:yes stop_codon:yes gene_type:complete